MDRLPRPPVARSKSQQKRLEIQTGQPVELEFAPERTHVLVPIIITGYMRMPNTKTARIRAEHGARVMIERVGSWLLGIKVETGRPQ